MKQHSIITALETRIAAELGKVDREQVYRDMLDDCGEEVTAGGLTFSPSTVLERCDPVAFRCGVSDYFGTSDGYVEDIGPDYETYSLDDAEKVKQELVDEITRELDEANAQLEAEQSTDDGKTVDDKAVAQCQAVIDEIAAKLAALEAHSF